MTGRATPDLLVVGAGITGAFAALEAAERGAQVLVIDRHGPAAMASGWTLAGVRQSGRDPAELPLARAAVGLWTELDARLGAETGYTQAGNLRLARTEAEAEAIRALVAAQSAAGLALDYLEGPERIRDVAPALAPDLVAASFCATDGHADPVATVGAVLAAAERAGATVVGGEAVHAIEVRGGRVIALRTDRRDLSPGAILLATGVETNALLGPLGRALPLRRPMVTVLRSAPRPPLIAQVLGVAGADLALRQERSGRLRMTSGAKPWSGEIDRRDGRPVIRPSLSRVADTIACISRVLPAAAAAELEAVWGGALDVTPDALPVLARVPDIDGLVVAAGFSGHGFGIAPVTGRIAADLALGRTPAEDIRPFRFDRFASAPVAAEAAPTLHG